MIRIDKKYDPDKAWIYKQSKEQSKLFLHTLKNYSSLTSNETQTTLQCVLRTHARELGVSMSASLTLHIAPLWTACPHNCSNILLCESSFCPPVSKFNIVSFSFSLDNFSFSFSFFLRSHQNTNSQDPEKNEQGRFLGF